MATADGSAEQARPFGARESRSPCGLRPEHRDNLLAAGIVLALVFQLALYGSVHPGAALVIGPTLICTPYALSRALASLAAMPNATMVEVDGGWNHGVMVPTGNPCVDVPVGQDLLNGTAPARKDTHCAQATPVASPGIFVDAVRAEALRARLAEAVGPAGDR